MSVTRTAREVHHLGKKFPARDVVELLGESLIREAGR